MLCFVKVESLDADEKASLLAKLVGIGWTSYDAQEGYKLDDDCIAIAANTNPNNSANRVYVGDVIEWLEKFDTSGGSYSAVEKDHLDGPSRADLAQCAGNDTYHYSHELKGSPEGLVCDEYFDDNFTECSCGCTEYSNRTVSNESGDDYCQSCYDDNYSLCGNCGCEISSDESYCESCQEDEEHDGVQEFDGRRKSFDCASSFGSSRYFGLELETDSGYVSESFAFDGKDDGSISGTEFVSHKLRGDAGLAEAKAFMASGHGIEISRSCGFHLHADMSDFSDEQLYAIAAAYAVTEDFWHSKVSRDRDGCYYCKRFSGSFVDAVFEAEAYGRDFRSFADGMDRYRWINISAYTKHSTFENRLHHGTWTYSEVEAWVVMNLRFIEAASNMRILAGETKESFAKRATAVLEESVVGSKAVAAA